MSRFSERISSLVRRPAARRTLFILAPIGYAVALLLEPSFLPIAQVKFRVGRREAAQNAAAFLASRGFNVVGWQDNVRAEVEDDVVNYIASLPPADAEALAGNNTGTFLRVSFWNEYTSSIAQVWFTPDAQIFRWKARDRNRKLTATTPEADRATAEAALHARYGARAARFTFERVSDDTTEQLGAIHQRQFVWIEPAGAATVERAVSVRAGKVVGESVRLRPPSGYTSGRMTELHRLRTLRMTVGISLSVLAAALLLWGVVRWFIRFQEHEVSHGRAAALAAGVLFGMSPAAMIGIYAAELDAGTIPSTSMMVMTIAMSIVMFGFLAIVCGMAWAGGEGDLRRLYPGKLASTDALLSGRILSRNVGRSVLVGLALGGIGSGLMALALTAGSAAGGVHPPITNNEAPLTAAPMPWLFMPSADLMGTILTTLAGLVIGLPLAIKITGDRRRAMILVGILLATLTIAETPAWDATAIVSALVAGGVDAAMLLVAFASWDLLAAFAATVALGLCRFAGVYFAQPNGEARSSGIAMMALLAAVALVAAFVAWRGREWREQELLPAYARRMALNEEVRAEMDLARQAQTRLLSRTAHAVPGLGIATDVIPASTVGGDYVDVFPRPDGGMLWIVADGGGRGAGAALAMTLTRGLLLALAGGRLNAAEVAQRLGARLENEIGKEAVPPFLIGTWEPGEDSVTLAKRGDYPRAGIRPQRGSAQAVEFKKAEGPVETVTVALSKGAGLVVWTDGIAALPDVWGAPLGDDRILRACDDSPRGSSGWRESLRARFDRHAGGLAPGRFADDLALLVVAREGGEA